MPGVTGSSPVSSTIGNQETRGVIEPSGFRSIVSRRLRAKRRLEALRGEEQMEQGQETRLAAMDQILDAIVGHLRHRDPHFAEHVERITNLARANAARIEESGLMAEVRAFAAMDLSRGKAPKLSASLQQAARDAAMTTGYLEAEFVGYVGKRTRADWAAAAQRAWRECFNREAPLSDEPLAWALRGTRSARDIALRLTFLAREPKRVSRSRQRRRQDRYKHFRKLVLGQNLRAHRG